MLPTRSRGKIRVLLAAFDVDWDLTCTVTLGHQRGIHIPFLYAHKSDMDLNRYDKQKRVYPRRHPIAIYMFFFLYICRGNLCHFH